MYGVCGLVEDVGGCECGHFMILCEYAHLC